MSLSHEIVNFAIAGYGHIGKRHAKMIMENPGSRLVAVCDIKTAEEAGFEQQDIPFYNDLGKMLKEHKEIDVVSICTPNGVHASQALESLASKKHVVIEKPMTLSKADAEAVIFKALHVSRQVFLVMQNRYSPPSAWLKEVIDKKILGEIFLVQVNCYWNRGDDYYKKSEWKGTRKLDGGVLFTQFAHFIDIMYWIFGDIDQVQARFENFNHRHSTEFEDSGIVNFVFTNGGIGCLNYSTSTWDKNMESSITVIGSNGSVKIGGQYMDKIEYCHIRDYVMPELPPANPPNDYGTYKGSAANHSYVIQNVIDTLRGTTSITTNALEGLKVVEIIERIYALRDKNNN